MISQERLKELVHYDPQTGIFTALKKRRGVVPRGGSLGSPDGMGYLRARFDGKKYKLSRLAFLYMKGKWPLGDVDHKNRITTDNRWENLRDATTSQNTANAKPRANSTGLKGVSKRKNQRKFIARLGVDSKSTFLGNFDCPAAAHFAYQVAADKHFGEFARFA